jgi:hypothetical protein
MATVGIARGATTGQRPTSPPIIGIPSRLRSKSVAAFARNSQEEGGDASASPLHSDSSPEPSGCPALRLCLRLRRDHLVELTRPHRGDQLSPEQAWDIAAYVVSQPRPHKAGLDKDFPDLLEKPIDAPYGPYADGFGEQQHKYGPFAPIRAAVARLKAEKAAKPTPPPR